jgi:hypothetical protein
MTSVDTPSPQPDSERFDGKAERAALEEFAKETLDPKNSEIEVPKAWSGHVDAMTSDVASHVMQKTRHLRLPGTSEGRSYHSDAISEDRALVMEQLRIQNEFRLFANQCIAEGHHTLLGAEVVDVNGDQEVRPVDSEVDIAEAFSQWREHMQAAEAGAEGAASE